MTGRQTANGGETASGAYEYNLSIGDYTRWLDHIPTLLGKEYAVGGAYTLITDIILSIFADSVSTSATTPYGVPGPACPLTAYYSDAGGYVSRSITVSLSSYVPNGKSVSQAFDELAKLTESIWYIDSSRQLWFINPDSTLPQAAPLSYSSYTWYDQDFQTGGFRPAVSLPTLNADTDTSTYFDLRVAEDASNVTSAVSAVGFVPVADTAITEGPASTGATNPVQSLTGDGNTKFFALANDPVDPGHTTVLLHPTAGSDTTYSVGNGNLKTEYLDGRPGDGQSADYCYVCTDNYGIRFNVAPPSGSTIKVTYNYYLPPSVLAQPAWTLASIISTREGFGPGFYWQVIDASAMKIPWKTSEVPVAPWLAAAYLMLKRYARIKILASFSSYTKGWAPGQIFFLYSPNRGDNAGVNANDAIFTGWGNTLLVRLTVTQTEESIVNDSQMLTLVEAANDIWGA